MTPLVCVSCDQAIGDPRDPGIVQAMREHRCPQPQGVLFELPAPAADPGRWTR